MMFDTNGFMHRKYATFIAYGPMIACASSVYSYTINIIDFLVTLLAMLHVPIPTDRHGRIIDEMFKSKDVIKPRYISKSKVVLMMKLRNLKKVLRFREGMLQ